jgi:hypothetical protein
MEPKQQMTKAHCNTCGGEKTHRILYTEATKWEADGDDIHGSNTYQMLKCGGCEEIKLRHSTWCTEDDPYDPPQPTYYPPAIFRPNPLWLTDLRRVLNKDDRFVHAMLGEIYVALQNDLPRLATMGVRALLEHIMVSKAGDCGTFGKNMDEFERLGFVSKVQRQRLEAILEAGHAAMHRSYEPETSDVVTLLDITEHIVETVFLHEKPVAKLREKIPPRTQPKK